MIDKKKQNGQNNQGVGVYAQKNNPGRRERVSSILGPSHKYKIYMKIHTVFTKNHQTVVEARNRYM